MSGDTVRIGIEVRAAGTFREMAQRVAELEQAGLDLVTVREAYSFDAVSQLGYLACATERVQITTGILPIYSRTPANLAMTAAGLDYVSDGRFTLGIGASGPQVVEGFHGVRYDAPLARTREVVEICRQVWRRERLSYAGRHHQIPLPPDLGTGLGKPLKLIDQPVRDRIPITIAATGPRNVALAAEIAEGWEPIFFHPEKAADAWGAALAEGRARRDATLPELDIAVAAPTAITDSPEPHLTAVRPRLALYIGGMGARGRNFYNDLARRYGYEAEATRIQDLYLDGHVREAAGAVPEDLVRAVTLIGPRTLIADRVKAFAEAGVTTLTVQPLSSSHTDHLRDIEYLKELAG
ncbi:MAG: LLM class F420-dependent oxidoreductase [Pseudonocardia sp.]|nr:LLM class F420-dependent oxidoreductase [Pseudonocardia sp.]